MRVRGRHIGLGLWFVFLLLPIYGMVSMSLQTNAEILGGFRLVLERGRGRHELEAAEDLRVRLQRHAEHPVDREQQEHEPQPEAEVTPAQAHRSSPAVSAVKNTKQSARITRK